MATRPSPTLAEALDDWLIVRSAGRGLSPNTVRAYRADVERLARELAPAARPGDRRPAAARVRVSQLTAAALVKALAAVQRSGAAPASRSRLHGTLEQLCKHLVHRGDLLIDPFTVAGLERPKLSRSLPRYIERDADMSRVLTAAATADPTGRMAWPERDLALAAVLVGTGCRAGELCGVRFRDLVRDVDDPYVRVLGKGNAARDCPLAPEVVLALDAYLASRVERTGRRPRRDDPLWLNNHGNPLLPPTLDHYVQRWFARAGVPLPRGAQAHAFRHTVAMQLVGRGEALNVVQALLGHASLRSTEIYIRAAGH
ncbi:MAG: tyrosine-type recombinase/integrase, partial [Candidatus Dormibacteria bacterium]